ncbi:MAG: ClpX C4-type zinc finger protein [Myxococcaceae bacterium]|nr:ClpX C4-type zinc finger protein [Myxococcaceae bacterium]
MTSEIRELLQRAQEAELQGDVSGAVDLLQRAADLHEDAGNLGRALKVLRHALRLDEQRDDVAQRVRRLEARMPPELEVVQPHGADEEVLPELEPSEALESAAREALAHLEGRGRGLAAEEGAPEAPETRAMIERGPSLADPALEAWCSFCCRPGREVGRLVAGPAGAFVCAACVDTAARLLRVGSTREGHTAGAAGHNPLTPSLSQGERGGGAEPLLAEALADEAVHAARHLNQLAAMVRKLSADYWKRTPSSAPGGEDPP